MYKPRDSIVLHASHLPHGAMQREDNADVRRNEARGEQHQDLGEGKRGNRTRFTFHVTLSG
jgi:hypothetical protein